MTNDCSWGLRVAPETKPVRPLVRKLPFKNHVIDSTGNVFLYWLFDKKMHFMHLYSIHISKNNLKEEKNEHYFRKNN